MEKIFALLNQTETDGVALEPSGLLNLMKVILILSLLAPNLLLGQGTPDTGNSKLWEMRKKVQQRSAQRASSHVQQMNQALQSSDTEGAESALKAAIAQGTLTQTQINDARGRIDSMVSQQRQAMVKAQKAEAEQAERMKAQSTASSNSAGAGGTAQQAAAGKSVSLKFIGSAMQSIRVFNVDAGGREARWPADGSPANCSLAHASEARDETADWFTVNLINESKGLAGTYGYEVTFVQILDRRLLTVNETGHRKTFKGTFKIPSGSTMGSLRFEKFQWGDTNVNLRTTFD